MRSAAAWRSLDLTEAGGRPVDAVIATRFPSYAVRHPNKIVWLIHQYRQAYDQFGTPLQRPHRVPRGPADARGHRRDRPGRPRRRRARSSPTRRRSPRGCCASTASAREPLYHPPPLAGRYRSGDARRHGALGRAARRRGSARGSCSRPCRTRPRRARSSSAAGPEEDRLRRRAAELGVGRAVRFLAAVGDEELLSTSTRTPGSWR